MRIKYQRNGNFLEVFFDNQLIDKPPLFPAEMQMLQNEGIQNGSVPRYIVQRIMGIAYIDVIEGALRVAERGERV